MVLGDTLGVGGGGGLDGLVIVDRSVQCSSSGYSRNYGDITGLPYNYKHCIAAFVTGVSNVAPAEVTFWRSTDGKARVFCTGSQTVYVRFVFDPYHEYDV